MNETGIHEEEGEKEIEDFDIGPDNILKHDRVIPRSIPDISVFTFHEY